jgi:uncharacterized protein YjbJ (UPF0337 family)
MDGGAGQGRKAYAGGTGRLGGVAKPKRKVTPPGPDALRTAVEQTYEATVGSVSETRDRAGQLVDQAVGAARRTAGQRTDDARQASADAAGKLSRLLKHLQRRLKP